MGTEEGCGDDADESKDVDPDDNNRPFIEHLLCARHTLSTLQALLHISLASAML